MKNQLRLKKGRRLVLLEQKQPKLFFPFWKKRRKFFADEADETKKRFLVFRKPLVEKISNRREDQENGKNNGKPKDFFLYSSSAKITFAASAKSGTESGSSLLEEDKKRKNNGNDNLSNKKVKHDFLVYREKRQFKRLIRKVVRRRGTSNGIWKPGKKTGIPQTKAISIARLSRPRESILKGVVSSFRRGIKVRLRIPKHPPAKRRV